MSRALIRAAIEQELSDWAADNSLTVAWENVDFTPIADVAYITGALLLGETISLDLLGKHRRYIGLYQVDLHLPQGSGPADADALVGLLEDAFPCNLRITEGSIEVLIIQPVSSMPAYNTDTHYVVPVSIPLRVDTMTS